MTRENKLALVIGFGLMLFVGILVSDHFSAQRFDPATVAEASSPQAAEVPTQLDVVGGEALVAQSGGIDLAAGGQSQLPDAPVPGADALVEPLALPVEVAKADGIPVRFRKVQAGDSYWKIAKSEYGDGSLAEPLRDYNKAVAPDAAKLALNSELRIPPVEVLRPGSAPRATGEESAVRVAQEARPAARAASVHTVQKGETAYGIARKQGVKVAELLQANGIKDPAMLKPGQALRIPVRQ